MNFEFSRQIFEKYLNIIFSENPSIGSRVVPRGRSDGQTERKRDITKLIIVSRNFAYGHKYQLTQHVDYMGRYSDMIVGKAAASRILYMFLCSNYCTV